MTNSADIRISEIMPQLPERWPLFKFEDCLIQFKHKHEKLKSKHIQTSGGIPVIDQGQEFICGYTNQLENRFPGPLPVIIFGDHTRRFKYVDFEFAVGADGTKALYPIKAIHPRFFYHYLCSLRLDSQGYSRHYRFLKESLVPIPPPNEQFRIVSKLENLLSKVDSCRNRLEKLPLILKRFRQSVLAAACSGRLTADWREQNPVDSIGPALEPEAGLPIGWKPVSIGDVIESLKYGTAQKCTYKKSGVSVLRIPNIRNGSIDHSDLKYATLPVHELKELRLQPGDILLIRSNGSVALVGKCALVREQEQGFAYAGYLIRIRPKRNSIDSEYLNLALSSYEIRLQIELEARSTSGVNNINSDEVKALRFSLPPLNEQKEIVLRVKALFAVADKIETRHAKAKAQVDKLTQSLLAKAFRGELVAQSSNNRPANTNKNSHAN